MHKKFGGDFVKVQSSELCIKIDVTYTSKSLILRSSGNFASKCLCVFIEGYVCKVFTSLYVSFSV